MNINPEILKKKLASFEEILHEVCNEFKKKLNNTKIKQYLNRDVKVGKNISIELIPLNIKKIAMKYFGKIINSHATTTLSNVGQIEIDNNYKKYIDNIFLYAKPWKVQKIKCSICSYENNLNISFTSSINDNKFQNIFYTLLKKDIITIKVLKGITN